MRGVCRRVGLGMTSFLIVVSPLVTVLAHGQNGRDASLPGVSSKHEHDFDYLLGDWEFTATSRYGPYKGTWSATLVGTGHVVDEFRVTGDKGELYKSIVTIRAYDATHDKWDLVSLGPGTGLQSTGSGRRDGAEVHIEQTFLLPNNAKSILRIVYHDIKPDSFLWSADQSSDGGKTWHNGSEQLWVKRTGPARSLPSLVPSK
jgi:hypothetical protein